LNYSESGKYKKCAPRPAGRLHHP